MLISVSLLLGGFGASAPTNNAFGQQQRPGFGGTGNSLFGATNTASGCQRSPEHSQCNRADQPHDIFTDTGTGGFGGFGTTQNQTGQQQPTGGLGIGGMTNSTSSPGNMFGSNATSGFGVSTSPFGAKPATNAFGSGTTTAGGLFGAKPASPFGQTGEFRGSKFVDANVNDH